MDRKGRCQLFFVVFYRSVGVIDRLFLICEAVVLLCGIMARNYLGFSLILFWNVSGPTWITPLLSDT